MRIHPSRRLGVLGALGVGLAGFGAIVTVGFSAGASDQPDLRALLPEIRQTSRFTDTVQVPGKVLYRFDSVIQNDVGALDVSRTDKNSHTIQTIYDGGDPGPLVTGTKDLTPLGGALAYSSVTRHNHFHTQLAAAYELDTLAGALVNKAAKNSAGFCLYDSYGQGPNVYGNDCHAYEPDYAGAIREGISRGWGDFYGSDLGDQWVDVTGVTPGTYLLKAKANPAGLYIESNPNNNSTQATVVIPGTTASGATGATTAGKTVDVPVAGTLVGADELTRKLTTACSDDEDAGDQSCVTPATPGRLTFAISAGPAAGTGSVQVVDATPDTAAVLRYTAPVSFTGTATFTYVASDSRGLVSKPATVTVTVTPGGSTASTGGGGGGTPPGTTGTPSTAKATVTLKPAFRLVRSGGRTFLKVNGVLPRSQSGRLVRVQRKVGKRITTIAGVRVAKTGRYATLVRVSTTSLSVRAALGSSATTKAALSGFRRIAF